MKTRLRLFIVLQSKVGKGQEGRKKHSVGPFPWGGHWICPPTLSSSPFLEPFAQQEIGEVGGVHKAGLWAAWSLVLIFNQSQGSVNTVSAHFTNLHHQH